MDESSTPNPDVYFKTLTKLSKNADKIRQKEDEEEKKLVEYLPVNERFNMDKENKVLTRWQERQRDWEKVELAISKKLKNKVSRPLMMTTTDEYRARLEEYDLIQAAIPFKDRFAETAWQMGLRGGGGYRVSVGHLFSGLEYEVKEVIPRPKMVRKPKSASATWKNDTFLDQTDSYLKKRKKYEKSIHDIRPHTITYNDATNLTITGMDLFQWAKESSQEYIQEQNYLAEESVYLQELQKQKEQEAGDQSLVDKNQSHNKNIHPKLNFLSTQDILFQTTNNQSDMKPVIFKNISTITLYYRWKRIDHPFTAHHAMNPTTTTSNTDPSKRRESLPGDPSVVMEKQLFSKGIHGILNDKQEDPASDILVQDNVELRGRLITQQRNGFHCLQEYGEILPNETMTTYFTFHSVGGQAGVYHNVWVLDILPESTHIFRVGGGGNDAQDSSLLQGSIPIHFHGHCVQYDEHQYERQMIQEIISQHSLHTYMKDILGQVIDMIRTPIRVTDIYQRKLALFWSINESLLNSYFNQYENTSSNLTLQIIPTKLTIDRMEQFHYYTKQTVTLVDGIVQGYMQLANAYQTQQQICYELLPNSFPIPVPYSLITCAHELIVTEEQQSKLQDVLFPEKKIESFDEITSEMLTVSWDYNIQTTCTALTNIRTIVFEIERLEKEMITMKKLEEKARQKASRRAARVAALEELSDYENDDAEDDAAMAEALADSDEDEDEEEPEEEDEETKKLIKPKHPLLQAVDQLTHEIINEIQSLLFIPLPEDLLYQSFYNEICHAIDEMMNCYELSLQEAQVYDYYKYHNEKIDIIPKVINPFTEEGKDYWETKIMPLTSAIPEPVVPVKGGKPPAAAKNNKDNSPPVPQVQQYDYFHKQFYTKVFEQLMIANDIARERFHNQYNEWLQQHHDLQTQFRISVEKKKALVPYRISLTNEEQVIISKETIDSNEQINRLTLSSTLPNMASYRSEDVENHVVYYNINADEVFDNDAIAAVDSVGKKEHTVLTAYPIHNRMQQRIGSEVIEFVKANCKMIVLVFESNQSTHTSFTIAQMKIQQLQESINTQYQQYQAKDLHAFQKQYRAYQKQLKIINKKLKKQKYAQNEQLLQEYTFLSNVPDQKTYKQLDYHLLTSYGQANYVLDSLLRNGNSKYLQKAAAGKEGKQFYYDLYIPILCVENIHMTNVIPKQPLYLPYESDDESVTISIGKEDFLASHYIQFQQNQPIRKELVITIPDSLQVFTSENNNSKHAYMMKQSVYCDTTAAVEELYTIGQYQHDDVIWIESNANALFGHLTLPTKDDEDGSNREIKNAIYQMKSSILSSRYLSHSLRETLLWIGVLLSLPQYQQILETAVITVTDTAAATAAPVVVEEEVDLSASLSSSMMITQKKEKVNNSPAGQQARIEAQIQTYGDFLSYHFPLAKEEHRVARVLFVLGGELKLEKFRFLDELITLVDSVYLVGEMAIPFLALSEHYSFLTYRDITPTYTKLCRHILKKARLLDCVIHLPTDIVLAEDCMAENAKGQAYAKLTAETRGDGADYDGDTKVINLTTLPTNVHDLQGYLYDLGPETCQHLAATIAACDGTMVWGLPSVCELNACQNGTQALIQAMALKPSEVPITIPGAKKVSVVWGESTVEWFARILDSDGEFQGDLISAGYVTYMNRYSISLYSVIGQYLSKPLSDEQAVFYREGTIGEWIYSRKQYEDEEEEEDEDE